MTILVTGSAGHLGEGLMRVLRDAGRPALGLDIKPSPYTDIVGSITDRDLLKRVFEDVRSVIHTATLHKPHVATHAAQDFIDTNVTGTLCLLEAAMQAQVEAFVFTSTTSTFGCALTPAPTEPAAWITEAVTPIPKNIYGATKLGAEHLCELFSRRRGLPLIILRTSRFFPEEDDTAAIRDRFDTANAQMNELLYRRADLADLVDAHLLALDHAPELGFQRFIASAPTPFAENDLVDLRRNAPEVLWRYFPEARAVYEEKGWSMFDSIDRVYVSRPAMDALGWKPKWDFAAALDKVGRGEDFRSPLARAVGIKGYHDTVFTDGPFPVED
ncbi:NAD(P)-dependent oxidoreductase [Hwanghaeella grinnelliae]|uniref:NAD(P)-dependent oxidoreductase n=1 Tax=Hwanghaeella grinnelliae TaxID=2500179 RepID=A0A3S2VR02_9PROT|nr:NAD(P)-dependent oxidoreductase [Hwanghaeella grinnelliae]RVU39560.1 NAD(P)-dependent oxidoreductase [Hwanghaeella grinnelliae]